MQVELIAASDRQGGAGIAAFRLLQGLKAIGFDSAGLAVCKKFSADPDVFPSTSRGCEPYARLLPYLDPLPKLLYPRRHRDAWSCNLLPSPSLGKRLASADVVNLHWVGAGTLSIPAIGRLTKPIVWTLHDSWPFTGGCHIPYDCTRYTQECGACPQLRSTKAHDLSRVIWNRKSQSWRQLPMTVVAPSRWMASAARASSLFGSLPIEVIPNGLDVSVFDVADKLEARRRLGLPESSRLILFSAMGGNRNWNKGADLLHASLQRLRQARCYDDLVLLTVGSQAPLGRNSFPFPCIDLGRVDDENRQRWVYAAADITAVPSRSESLGYVAMESMACGTPCVAFATGGVLDVIDPGENGCLCPPYSVEAYAEALAQLLNDEERRRCFGENARKKVVARFALETVAEQYARLFLRVGSRISGGAVSVEAS
jgi:glycosyltransferase involved in cell wall biosynthesis